MNNSKFAVILVAVALTTLQSGFCEPASKSPTTALTTASTTLATNQVAVASDDDLPKYLIQMRAPLARYLKIMLDLVPLAEPPDDNCNEILVSDHAEILSDTLSKIAPPAAIAELHSQMKAPLNRVVVFAKNGGVPKIGFSKALAIAQQMQEISDAYHAEILKIIEAKNLSKSSDPFLVQETKASANAAGGKINNLSVITKGGYGVVEKNGHARNGLESIRESASANFDLKDSKYSSGSMINGVGGAMGMTGLFNGLGGTGTNGLVDGLGFSSGLNGYVNGAGQSSGTSGMFNDMNVMSPSSSTGSMLHY